MRGEEKIVYEIGGFLRAFRFPPPIKLTATMT